jgi:hypothetical protein
MAKMEPTAHLDRVVGHQGRPSHSPKRLLLRSSDVRPDRLLKSCGTVSRLHALAVSVFNLFHPWSCITPSVDSLNSKRREFTPEEHHPADIVVLLFSLFKYIEFLRPPSSLLKLPSLVGAKRDIENVSSNHLLVTKVT